MRSGLCRYMWGINEMHAVKGYWGYLGGWLSKNT